MLKNQKVEEIEKKYVDFFESLLQSLINFNNIEASIEQLVLVITFLGGWFEINCSSIFLKILKLP